MRISTNQIYQRGLDNLLTQQERLARLQDQQASGIRVRTPSDDPVASAQIELIKQRINNIELFQNNRQAADSALRLEEGILSNAVNSLHRLREIQIQAGNPSLSEEDRKTLAVEAQALLNQLLDYANTKDSNGSYMFSGSKSLTQPVSLNLSGQYVYNGDSTQRFQAVTTSLLVAVNDTGDNVFMRIPSGNGRFAIRETLTPNTGTASVSSGSVTNEAAFVPDNYTMTFALNSQGNLVVMVSGTLSGNVIPPSGLPDDAPLYQEGSAIGFNGMEMVVSGLPKAGDSFSISPAKNESIFSTVQRMINNLNKPYTSSVEKAATQTENNQLLAQIDSALGHILSVQSDLGARLNQLETAEKANNDYLDISAATLKKLREIDPVAVATELNLQLVNLQAAQLSFTRIQGLSLFNFL
ncbi:TPA: flagellar hook-associated protein FlgL [Legionella pneumophila]|uniref:Flagellar hook associated protein type 3 FlgL n=2 Tax=Legionella pneumophila TaxID=446 RepID=Q5ZW61_LEGPH|nr:flagellar hook-associated protein FlgL [Legionella pneumophila]AAU27310.1 flagellar hook associated protein type 3 FlgL [Legionella pneumophila subsp. pneumophila str. Philadelphia 1]AEW51474.1 flagellar hook associated protein type 3 FlgL [Legionella pneumophila subsp. pneumophila ATCC 43290]AGH54029.1 Flagellar hook-associated protein FlgL [Legionella pneumophila subsp. pneumophila LPE509]AGN14122.1 flagellar hook-associated protein FlgL [Legionella pneumophila subsp. pneumophila str. Thun